MLHCYSLRSMALVAGAPMLNERLRYAESWHVPCRLHRSDWSLCWTTFRACESPRDTSARQREKEPAGTDGMIRNRSRCAHACFENLRIFVDKFASSHLQIFAAMQCEISLRENRTVPTEEFYCTCWRIWCDACPCTTRPGGKRGSAGSETELRIPLCLIPSLAASWVRWLGLPGASAS